MPSLTVDGYEADDVVGTIAWRAVDEGMAVTVVCADKASSFAVSHCQSSRRSQSDRITAAFRGPPDADPSAPFGKVCDMSCPSADLLYGSVLPVDLLFTCRTCSSFCALASPSCNQ